MQIFRKIKEKLTRLFRHNYPIKYSEPLDIVVTNTKKVKKIQNAKICYKCKNKFKGYADIFYCAYCQKYFCSEHRLPEKHNCKGNPKAPTGGFVEIHTKEGIKARGN